MKKLFSLFIFTAFLLSGCSPKNEDIVYQETAEISESIIQESDITTSESISEISETTSISETVISESSVESEITSDIQTEIPETAAETKKKETENIQEDKNIPQNTSKPDDDRILSDGSATETDKYKTDPVPEGMPMPVEPEDAEIDKDKKYKCTFSIECSTILDNLSELDPDKLDVLPEDGIILPACEVEFSEGESVFDVLRRICMENNIHMEFSWTPMYNSAYIEGINNLYEFDCGSLSGWMYCVNGWYPNYGCSRYQLADGEVVEWRYTCDLGNDIGGGYAVGET